MRFRGLGQLTLAEFRLNLRDPMTVFWSLAFPALWMSLFGSIFSEPVPGFGYEGLSLVNFLLPGGIGIVVVASAFIGMPITLTTYRETGVLKRLRVTPLKASTLALGVTFSQFLFITLGVLVLFAVGKIFFNIQVFGSWAALIGVTVLGMLTFLALGSAIGSVVGSWRGASIVTQIFFIPMLFLSNLFMPIDIFPTWLQPICKALPLTPMNILLRDIVYGVPLDELWQLGIMAGWLVFGCLVTLKFFRWE
ncbi:ABC transporter permease [Chloroflexota bacterium]